MAENTQTEYTVRCYASILVRDPGLKQGIIKKEPPLQLDLTVLDEAGRDDSGATRVLYNALLQAQNSYR